MRFQETNVAGVMLITPDHFDDERGFFERTWAQDEFEAHGLESRMVQRNTSYNRAAHTLRGMHFQEPDAQGKLVQVVRGAVWDVAADVRRGSPTFGRWVGLTVSEAEWNQIYVPAGFAHGFVTLEPNTEVLYKVSAPYSPKYDRAIRFDDPAIGVDWPLAGREPILSDKDRNAGLLAQAEPAFRYEAP